jgi:Ni/Co efflux regulator RcnB
MKRLRILIILTALTMGTSALASAQEFHNQRSGYQNQYRGRDQRFSHDQHFDRDRYNGVQYRYPVYDRDDRWGNRSRWSFGFTFGNRDNRGRHEYGDRRY